MATYIKHLLSGSTDGKGIKVVQTATAGDTIHTAHATSLDEIWLYAVNEHSTEVTLVIEFGGTTDPDNTITITLNAESGLVPIVPGFLLTNSLVVKAFASTENVVMIYGFVNRIS